MLDFKNKGRKEKSIRRAGLHEISTKKELREKKGNKQSLFKKICVILQTERGKRATFVNQKADYGILTILTPGIRDDACRGTSSVAVGAFEEDCRPLHELTFLSREVQGTWHHPRRHQES
jgi:hypothetical protein